MLVGHLGKSLETAAVLMVLGGPMLFLLGETFFRLRMIGSANAKRLAAIAALASLALIAGSVSALMLTAIVAVLLTALALWEHEALRAG